MFLCLYMSVYMFACLYMFRSLNKYQINLDLFEVFLFINEMQILYRNWIKFTLIFYKNTAVSDLLIVNVTHLLESLHLFTLLILYSKSRINTVCAPSTLSSPVTEHVFLYSISICWKIARGSEGCKKRSARLVGHKQKRSKYWNSLFGRETECSLYSYSDTSL